MTEATPYAEAAENFAVIKAPEAQEASAKAVQVAEEATETALKVKDEEVEKSAVIRAVETRPLAKADEGAAAKEVGIFTRSAAKAKVAAAAKLDAKVKNGVVTRAAAKSMAAATKAKEEADRLALDAETARRAKQSSAAKLQAAEARKAVQAKEDAKRAASKAETEAIANAIQEVMAQDIMLDEQDGSANRPEEATSAEGTVKRKPVNDGGSKLRAVKVEEVDSIEDVIKAEADERGVTEETGVVTCSAARTKVAAATNGDDTTLGLSGYQMDYKLSMDYELSVAPCGPSASPVAPSVADPLANMCVQLFGLKTAEFNGRLGKLLDPAPDVTGRYQVRLSATVGERPTRILLVKPQNLVWSNIDAQPFGTSHQSAKDKKAELQETKVGGEIACQAREASAAGQKGVAACGDRSKAKGAEETATADSPKQKERDSVTKAGEAEASAGNVVGGAGDEQAQYGGKVPLLSPASGVGISVGGNSNDVEGGHGWSGPTSFEDMCRFRAKLGFGWPYLGNRPCDLPVLSDKYFSEEVVSRSCQNSY